MIIAGATYGQLVAKRPVGLTKGKVLWECLCSCGNTATLREEHIKTGHTTSCGHCNYREKHPDAYVSWFNMTQRCYNKNTRNYKDYGGRGITVCERWRQSFLNFLADMGDPPRCAYTNERHTLDRIENSKNYYKDNCHWITRAAQLDNRRTTLHPGLDRRISIGVRQCK